MTENLIAVSKHIRFLQCKFVWSLVDDSVHVNKTTRMHAVLLNQIIPFGARLIQTTIMKHLSVLKTAIS